MKTTTKDCTLEIFSQRLHQKKYLKINTTPSRSGKIGHKIEARRMKRKEDV
jgi:hypothetical protein